jgi:hypothetical protein
MSERLSAVIERYRAAPERLHDEQRWPVLVWPTAPAPEKRELIWSTVKSYPRLPPAHDPLLFQIRKDEVKKTNAFGVGITLGRTQNNDIAVDEPSISRFHAFFQQDPKSGVWHVVDAESANGSFLGDAQLMPKRPAPLHDQAELRFGNVELRFFLPSAFEDFLAQQG